MSKDTHEARVASVSDFYDLPMGNLHEEFGQAVKIRGDYEKQVKVRGHFRPLIEHIGQQR